MMQIRRNLDNTMLFSNRVEWFEGWRIRRGRKHEMETTNQVTFTQLKGRREWIANTAFKFSNEPGFEFSTIDYHMYWFLKLADEGEYFNFTDRWANTYVVHVRNELNPERDEEAPMHPFFVVEADLLIKGFE